MAKIFEFENVSGDMTENEVALYNMKVCDDNLSLQWFIVSAFGWLNANKDKNYQDLEKELRNRNFNTHLFAKKINLENNMKLILPNSQKEGEYECIFSCRPKEYALKEVLKHHKSYEENFEKLVGAGSIHSEDEIKNKNVIMFSDNEKDKSDLISNNKRKIIIRRISPQEFISDIKKEIVKKYKKEPESVLHGITKDGAPILMFCIDNKIVSNYGYVKRVPGLNLPEFEIYKI